METTLYIKNMVCDRCIAAVGETLNAEGIKPVAVELGLVRIGGGIDKPTTEKLRDRLEKLGFGLLGDRREQTVERIKNAVVDMVHRGGSDRTANLSDYIAGRLNADYSALSRMFSGTTGCTIERYYIMQRIERVKELIQYGELTLGQIAADMNYSSTAYLSSQFKNVTGMTPSQYKTLKRNSRKRLDQV